MSTYRRSALGPVQVAIYQWLIADSTLMGLVSNKVYDWVPQGTTPPYIEIAELIETPDNTEGDQGRSVQVTIFAFSMQPGFAQIEAILDRLLFLLDEEQFPASSPTQGWSMDYNNVMREEIVRLPDGIGRQLAIQVQVLATRDIGGE